MRWGTPIAVLMGLVLLVCMQAVPAGPTPTLSAAAPSSGEAAPGRILVLGDSLSAEYGLPRNTGWVTLLESRLADRQKAYQIRNASISGDTTIGGLQRLPAMLGEFEPDILILQLGANDGLRGQPVVQMKSNLAKMVALAQNRGAKVLLVGQQVPPNYGQRYADSFHAAYTELAHETGAKLVPFMLEGFAANAEMFQADGLHPTAQAQSAILENIWGGLEPLLD